jgi:predicted transport protein
MPLFLFDNDKAHKITAKEFDNEIELHKLIDKNLDTIFGIRFLRDEYVTEKHGRIETLGLDEDNRPVVIEYKKHKDKGQLTQANRYMTWIRQNPDSFELLVLKNIKNYKGKIDFSNPRIICFAQEFSIDDKCLALSLDAELWKYRYYANNTISITREEEPEQLIVSNQKNVSIKKIPRMNSPKKSIEDHLAGASEDLKELFYQLEKEIFEISSSIDRYTTNAEINYKTSRVFAYLSIQNKKNCLRYSLRTNNSAMIDEKGLTLEIPKSHGWGNITRQLTVNPEDIRKDKYTISDVMQLLMQAYEATQ